MKIAFICNGSFKRDFRNFNYYQRSFFLGQHNDLTLFLPSGVEVSEEIQNIAGIRYSSFNGKLGFLFFLSLKIYELKNFDLILTEPSAFSIFGFIAKSLFGVKWVIDIWDIPFRDLTNTLTSRIKRKLQVFAFKPIFKIADLYIVSMLPQFQLKEVKLDDDKMKCFMNAIHLDEFENIPDVEPFDKFTILIQRSVFFKGFGLSLILDSLKELKDKIDIQLIIVGTITDEAMQEINHYGMDDKIILTGFIEHHKFIETAKRSHVCVIPYPEIIDLRQIYPIKAIEYLALGKTIVYTEIDGLKKIIGDAGIPVYPINVENLVIKILEVYYNPDKIKQFEAFAKSRAADYDAAIKNSEIIGEFNNLINH